MFYYLPLEAAITTSNRDNMWAPWDCNPRDISMDDFGDGYADDYGHYYGKEGNFLVSTNTYGGDISTGFNDEDCQVL